MKTILCPTDFSDVAENAFDYTLKLAEALDAWVILLHVHRYNMPETPLPVGLDEALQAEDEREALKEFEAYEAAIQTKLGTRVHVIHRFAYGAPAEKILRVSRECNPDLIIMGSTGKNHQDDRPIGGITTNIIQHAHCPVLAIPNHCRFRDINTIVYAANFEEESLDFFDKLIYFARLLDAKVSCVHVKTGRKGWDTVQLNFFNTLFKEKIDTHEMEFYLQTHPDLVKGLNEFMNKNNGDMLAMLNPNHDLLQQLFQKSLIQEMTRNTQVPLLSMRKEAVEHLIS